MPRSISLRKFIQKLKKFGFEGPYTGKKHPYVVKGSLKLIIPNPHQGDISKHLLSEILRQAGIPSKDWDNIK